jgi:hypothetical protein
LRCKCFAVQLISARKAQLDSAKQRNDQLYSTLHVRVRPVAVLVVWPSFPSLGIVATFSKVQAKTCA